MDRDEQKRIYYQNNREKILARQREYAKNNQHVIVPTRKAYYWKVKAEVQRRNNELKLRVFAAYSQNGIIKCTCCQEPNPIFLTLDHVDNKGNEHRRQLAIKGGTNFYRYLEQNNYPTDPPLQLLCYNCNNAKRVTGGKCPHKDMANSI